MKLYVWRARERGYRDFCVMARREEKARALVVQYFSASSQNFSDYRSSEDFPTSHRLEVYEAGEVFAGYCN